MTYKQLSSAIAATLLVAALPACAAGGSINNEPNFDSVGKPDPVSLPLTCPQSAAAWSDATDYPSSLLNIGLHAYEAADVFAPDSFRFRADRVAIVSDIAAVLLNVEIGDEVPDDVLVAVASLDEWLIRLEEGGRESDEARPEAASLILSDYFDHLRPCNYDDKPVVEGTDTTAPVGQGDALDGRRDQAIGTRSPGQG